MSNHLPWYDISIPDADYNVRLAPDCGAIPVYWGKDCDGKFLCLVSLAGDFQSRFMQEKLSVKEILHKIVKTWFLRWNAKLIAICFIPCAKTLLPACDK